MGSRRWEIFTRKGILQSNKLKDLGFLLTNSGNFCMKTILTIAIVVFSYGVRAGLKESSQKPCAFSLPSSLQKTQFLQSSGQDDGFNNSLQKKQLTHSTANKVLKNVAEPIISSSPPAIALNQSSCPEFHKLEGEELVQAVLEAENSCIVSDVFYAEDQNFPSLFAEHKLLPLIRKFAELAGIYQGDNQDKIVNVLIYIWGGYYNLSYHYEMLNEHFTDHVTSELHLGLSAFVNNSYFISAGEEHLRILEQFIAMLSISGQAVPYIDKLVYLLDHFSLDHPEEMQGVLLKLFEMYRISHVVEDSNNLEFINYILNESTEPLEALIRFSRRENLLNETKRADLLYKAVENIGHFLQYGDDPFAYHLAHSRLEELIREYSMESRGGVLRFLASAAVDYWSRFSSSELRPSCNTNFYDICSYASEWRDFLFRPEYTYTCRASDEIKIKFMRDVPMAQRQSACEDLIEIDNLFHAKLRTNKVPLPNDNSEVLEAVIFASSEDYELYGGPIYDIDTDNGGLYLEGNPEDKGNTPVFFAYENGDENNLSIWNFKHEFVHYLDGRYIRSGGYGEYAATGAADWWGEGIAEYIAKGGYYARASSYLQQKIYRFSQLIPNGGDAVKVYFYGYAATRFLVENFFHIAEELIQTMKDGYTGYTETLDRIGEGLDADFSSYLDELSLAWADREEEGAVGRYDGVHRAGSYCYAEPGYK